MIDDYPPPWIALPDLDAYEPATHGMAEVYIGLNWHPFWRRLTPEQKIDYLDRWDASPAWRAAIKQLYDGEGIDWEEEGREADAWQAQRNAHERRSHRWTVWRRLTGWLR